MKSFNEKWAEFTHKNENTYSRTDRAMALMGYAWAVELCVAGVSPAEANRLATEAQESENASHCA